MNFFIVIIYAIGLMLPMNTVAMYSEIFKAPSYKYPKESPVAFLDSSYKVLISIASMRGLFESTYRYEKEDIQVKYDLVELSKSNNLEKEKASFVSKARLLLETKEILMQEYLDRGKGKPKKIIALYELSERKEQLLILDWIKKVYGLTLKADMLLMDFDTYCEKEYEKELKLGEIELGTFEETMNYIKKHSDFASIRTHGSKKVAELHSNIVFYEEFFLESIDILAAKEKIQAKKIEKEFLALQEEYYAYLDIFYAPLRKLIEESIAE